MVHIEKYVALHISYSSQISADRMKPRSGDWAVKIAFLIEATITSLSSGSNVKGRCFLTACTTYSYACRKNTFNSKFAVLSNKISIVLDLLLHRLKCICLSHEIRHLSSVGSVSFY
uniref:Uncharacterized protein n=1 Tax=Timema poppense TaxID=170557 RepID=A0A7R9H340_TIMPO|nr:unnamed protein product [Timema poppensis]